MQVVISPSFVSGTIQAPASKSAMQRACAAALLKKGTTIIQSPGRSNDDQAALSIIQQLGAVITDEGDEIEVQSNGVQPVSDSIHCGESGLSIRMFTPIAALSSKPITITGEGSLQKRPMDFFTQVLPQLSVRVESNEGKAPLRVHGPLQPKNINVDGSLSSQYLTGLLFAYAGINATDVVIEVDNLNSKPYVDLTLHFLQQFGLPVPQHRNYEAFYFKGDDASKKSEAVTYSVEGDWSGAAFLLVAGAVAGSVTVEGLDADSTQADRAIMSALEKSGAQIKVDSGSISVSSAALRAFEFDATHCPDLFPPLVALASYCNGVTRISGVNRLAHKESNRGLTLQEEFEKLGVAIDIEEDVMTVHGGSSLKGATVHSHHDHRIAMACAVAALRASGDTVIEVAEAVNKSYPQFWQHLQQLQASEVTMGN